MTYTKSTYGDRCLIWSDLLSGVAIHFGKLYSWPSQKWLLKKAEEWKGLKCSLSTLNRDLKKMGKGGWFKRTRRITREGIYAGRFKSTLYTLGRKMFKVAIKMKKMADRVLSFSRLSNLANNKSQRENEILKVVAPNVDNLWKAGLEGKPSPAYVRR